MAASVESYLTVIRKAYDGRLKLPAFQRDWKWKPSQVTLLLDSLRQGFPIGSFLFLQANPEVDLAPRDFKGSSEEAKSGIAEELVLDGQQRITAGLELFFDRGANHYFINIAKVARLASDRKVDLENRDSIRLFLADLDADDGYCVRNKSSPNPVAKLIDRKLLWTGLLLDDDDLERAINDFCKAHPSDEQVMRYLIGRHFRPNRDSNIPITTIAGSTPIEAISRIFSTLNSTGKMLTPFELVVSVLFSQSVSLNDDVQEYRELAPYYAKIDRTGDILLQTIALFAGRDTKKASLPKTITSDIYRANAGDCVQLLEEAAQFVSERVGLGLDASDELLVYPVIFTPFAFIWKGLKGSKLDHSADAMARQKLARWFVGAILNRRYQQSTHDKQARDKQEITKWINSSDDKDSPEWLRETYIQNIRFADPDGAVGKLFRALMNSKGLRDPITDKPVGVGADKKPSSKHHIFPSRWVKHLAGWSKDDSANLALNIMYVEQTTNGSWLNSDPRDQVRQSIDIFGEAKTREIYRSHGIVDVAFDILLKPGKTKSDFDAFILERENFFASELEYYGFRRPLAGQPETTVDDDDDA